MSDDPDVPDAPPADPAARFAIGKPGEIPRLFLTALPDDASAQCGAGEIALEIDQVPEDLTRIATDGTRLEAEAWPLAIVKQDAWTAARTVRDAIAEGGCATPSGRVDTQVDSRGKITSAATAALVAKTLGQPFSIDWTMADNSVVTLEADAMLAMNAAVVAFVAACQNAGTAVRERIDGAADADAVAAIDITGGYPA